MSRAARLIPVTVAMITVAGAAGSARPSAADDSAIAATAESRPSDFPAGWRRIDATPKLRDCSGTGRTRTAYSIRTYEADVPQDFGDPSLADPSVATAVTTVAVFRTPAAARVAVRRLFGSAGIACIEGIVSKSSLGASPSAGSYPVAEAGVPFVARWIHTWTDAVFFKSYALRGFRPSLRLRFFFHIVSLRRGRTVVSVDDSLENRQALRAAQERTILRHMARRLPHG